MYACVPQVEAELEASRNHIREESARISSEATKLRQEQLKLKTESETIAKEKERLEALEKDVERKSQEAKNLCQVCKIIEIVQLQMYVEMDTILITFSVSLHWP